MKDHENSPSDSPTGEFTKTQIVSTDPPDEHAQTFIGTGEITEAFPQSEERLKPAAVPIEEPGSDESGEDGKRYFAQYELLEEIARGGMGVVYKARQVQLNRVVAIKMILSGKLASELDVKRFLVEAETSANLDHPGIVPVYEFGEHNDTHYFSMAYVDGPSLAMVASEQKYAPREAAEILLKVAEAVAYAHSRGVVHRDLKPHNILLESGGQPRITDFGLAKLIDADDELTQDGTIMGSLYYMPPEQASGNNALMGPPADIYALGAILYDLLAGRPPFEAPSTMEMLNQVMEREPTPPSRSNPRIPADLETICLKCLEKDIARRFHTAEELCEELRRFLRGEPILSRPIGRWEYVWRWCRRNPLPATLTVALTTALLVGVVTATTLMNRARAEREQREGQQRTVGVLSQMVLRKTTDQMEDWLNRFFEPVERELLLMREWTYDGTVDAERPHMTNQLLIPLVELYPQISSYMIADDRGREHMLMCFPETGSESTEDHWLFRRTRIDEWGQEVEIYEWYGERSDDLSPLRKTIEYDPRETVWFQGGINKRDKSRANRSEPGMIHWTDPYVFFVTKDLGITASINLNRAETPDVNTIVAFDVLLMDLTRFTINGKPTPHGKFLILSEDGKLVGLPHGTPLPTPEDWKPYYLKPMTDLNQPVVDAASSVFTFSQEAELQIQSFESGDAIWWGAAKPFRMSDELTLWMLVLVPESDLHESITETAGTPNASAG
ncbi:MAG: protein kinase [Planctomycetaceae bacterium]|nr:protein kinase [Planctomycetaceae bacterium]